MVQIQILENQNSKPSRGFIYAKLKKFHGNGEVRVRNEGLPETLNGVGRWRLGKE